MFDESQFTEEERAYFARLTALAKEDAAMVFTAALHEQADEDEVIRKLNSVVDTFRLVQAAHGPRGDLEENIALYFRKALRAEFGRLCDGVRPVGGTVQ